MYLRGIRKPGYPDDKCWFCNGAAKMTQSHVLLHCKNPKLMAARLEPREGKNPGGVRASVNPRWERRFVRFLELSRVGRTMKDGTDEESAYATRMDEWWRGKRSEEGRREGKVNLLERAFPCFLSYCMGVLLPPRLAHSAPAWRLEEQGLLTNFFVSALLLVHTL